MHYAEPLADIKYLCIHNGHEVNRRPIKLLYQLLSVNKYGIQFTVLTVFLFECPDLREVIHHETTRLFKRCGGSNATRHKLFHAVVAGF
jgi:hypothetical protein